MIPTVVTFVVMLAVASFAAAQNQAVYDQRSRADVLKEMSVVRAKLEGNISANVQLVRGLVAVIATEPEMEQPRFAELAGKLFADRSQLRNIAAAPDLVVKLMYPLEGNEQAIGLDYRNNAAQREATQRARQTGQMVLAGPVDLVQGGRGFIGRFPVFIGEAKQQRFWGIVSAVVDVERLYEDLYALIQSTSDLDSKEFRARVVEGLIRYETSKAQAGLSLSSRVFNKLNPEISRQWGTLCNQLGITPSKDPAR
ncbi:MAG: hypothetical protein EOP21_10140 [Hyphomicrobiales bacterium]|nr:MAG: hypothetical protein EOP21_10140 [Hyphomicrobiales bacterium]